jgi:hypothetical protein
MGSGLSLKTVDVPDYALEFTNKVFMSAADIEQLSGNAKARRNPTRYIQCARNATAGPARCIFIVEGHQGMDPGTIAFNPLHREWAAVDVNEQVSVRGFKLVKDSELSSCTIEWVQMPAESTSPETEAIKEEELKPLIHRLYAGQLFSVTQPILFEFNSIICKLTVTELGGSKPSMTFGLFTHRTQLSLKQGTSEKGIQEEDEEDYPKRISAWHTVGTFVVVVVVGYFIWGHPNWRCLCENAATALDHYSNHMIASNLVVESCDRFWGTWPFTRGLCYYFHPSAQMANVHLDRASNSWNVAEKCGERLAAVWGMISIIAFLLITLVNPRTRAMVPSMLTNPLGCQEY